MSVFDFLVEKELSIQKQHFIYYPATNRLEPACVGPTGRKGSENAPISPTSPVGCKLPQISFYFKKGEESSLGSLVACDRDYKEIYHQDEFWFTIYHPYPLQMREVKAGSEEKIKALQQEMERRTKEWIKRVKELNIQMGMDENEGIFNWDGDINLRHTQLEGEIQACHEYKTVERDGRVEITFKPDSPIHKWLIEHKPELFAVSS